VLKHFLVQFEICAEHNGWTVDEKAAQLKCCLTDEASLLVWDTGKPTEVSYSQLTEKLRRRYGFMDQQEKFEAELRARRQGKGESLAELCQDIRCLMIKAYPGQDETTIYQRPAKEHFLTAMSDRVLAS